MLESVKHQLADVIVRSRKMEQDQEKKSALRHNKQMEEIRNRHVSPFKFVCKKRHSSLIGSCVCCLHYIHINDTLCYISVCI